MLAPTTFDDVLEAIEPYPKKRVAVAVGQDDAVLEAGTRAELENVADCILVGDADKIRACADALGTDLSKADIVHEKDVNKGALKAIELVNPKMPATQDAASLAMMSLRGQFESRVVEGPLALDLAVSKAAAKTQGVGGEVAGAANVLLASLEAGNILVNGFAHLGGGRIAGLVVGAKAPIVLTSRATARSPNSTRSRARCTPPTCSRCT